MRKLVLSAVVTGLLVAGSVSADWDNNPGFENPYTNAWYSFEPDVTTNSSTFTRNSSAFSLEFATPEMVANDVPGGDLPSYTVVDYPHNAATPSVTYTASAYYYVDSALLNHERLGLGIYWLDSSGTMIDGIWKTVFGPETSTGGPNFPTGQETIQTWMPILVTSTAPASAAFMQVAMEVRGAGSTVYFDDVDVIPEPASILLVGMGLMVVAVATRRKML